MSNQDIEHHKRMSMAFRAIPIVFAFVLAANVGLLYFLGGRGGSADGDRVEIVLATSCAQSAAPLVMARVDAIGLGDPELDTAASPLRLRATLPDMPDARTHIPALLARRGALRVLHGEAQVASSEDMLDSVLTLDEGGMPFNQLSFRAEAVTAIQAVLDQDPDGELVFLLDDEELARRPNAIHMKDGALKVAAGTGVTRERMLRATDRQILLTNGPLPCDVEVASVTPIPAAE